MYTAEMFREYRSNCQKNWLLRFFTQGTSLGSKLFNVPQQTTLVRVLPPLIHLFKVYESSWWWNRWWFLSFMPEAHRSQFLSMLEFTRKIKQFSELNQYSFIENHAVISKHFCLASYFLDTEWVFIDHALQLARGWAIFKSSDMRYCAA